MEQIKRKDRKRVRDLFAMLGSSNPQEQATAAQARSAAEAAQENLERPA